LLAEEKERFRQDHLAWTVPKLEEALPGANPVEQGVIRNLICQKKGFFRAEVKNWTLSKIKKCEVKEDWQKEILGEELANRKKKAEAKQAQQARRQTMTAKEVLASSQSADARALKKRLTQHGPEGTLAYLLFSAYKASSRAKVYRGSVKTNRGKLSYRGLSYSRKGNVLKKLAQFLCEHSSLVLGWGWGIDPEGWFQNILYIDLPEGQVSFHSRERYGGRDYTSQWDGQQKSEERILAFCDRKLNEPLASPP
jgi:hypothetical protein